MTTSAINTLPAITFFYTDNCERQALAPIAAAAVAGAAAAAVAARRLAAAAAGGVGLTAAGSAASARAAIALHLGPPLRAHVA